MDDYDEEKGQEEADKVRQGDRKGYNQCFRYTKQGSNCEECQQIIVDKSHRYYPHLCESCSAKLFYHSASDYFPQ